MLYLCIIVLLNRQKNSLHLATEVIRKRARRNRKITLMLVTMVVIFYAIWIPHNVYRFVLDYRLFRYESRFPCVFEWLALKLPGVLYPVVNPVLYYMFNDKYRRGFIELLCFPWPDNKCSNCVQPSVPPQGENNV